MDGSGFLMQVSFSRLIKSSVPLCLAAVLSSCTFGVPMGSQPSSHDSTPTGKSKYGNPSSYVVMGQRYFVLDSYQGFTQRGKASWYGADFHGKRTSSGEVYNMHDMTAAHKTLPLPVYVKVNNLDNGKTIVVKVNDRGPFVEGRIIDLSFAAAKELGVVGPGTANVEISALESKTSEARPPVRVIPLKVEAEVGGIFVQLGSFGSELNAKNMISDLEQQNEKPLLISQVTTASGLFYRVRLGPLLDVNEATSVQKRLKSKGFSNARVVVDDE